MNRETGIGEGLEQLLFFAWLYGVEHDKFKPRIPEGASQEDLIRISRFYDLAPENPQVDMKEALSHLPIKDILQNIHGKREIFDRMVVRKPNDPAWFDGGLYHDDKEIGVPSFWFASWYDVSVGPNIALFNHVRNNAKNTEIRDNQYLVIAPVLHCSYNRATENTIVGERNVGDARLNYDEQIYAWFDFMLKGSQNDFKSKTPRVQYYTMGSNIWQSAGEWPPKTAKMTTFFLQARAMRIAFMEMDLEQLETGKFDQPDRFHLRSDESGQLPWWECLLYRKCRTGRGL